MAVTGFDVRGPNMTREHVNLCPEYRCVICAESACQPSRATAAALGSDRLAAIRRATPDPVPVCGSGAARQAQAWELPRLTVNVGLPTRRHLPSKVRCFVGFLVGHFETMDFERRWPA